MKKQSIALIVLWAGLGFSGCKAIDSLNYNKNQDVGSISVDESLGPRDSTGNRSTPREIYPPVHLNPKCTGPAYQDHTYGLDLNTLPMTKINCHRCSGKHYDVVLADLKGANARVGDWGVLFHVVDDRLLLIVNSNFKKDPQWSWEEWGSKMLFYHLSYSDANTRRARNRLSLRSRVVYDLAKHEMMTQVRCSGQAPPTGTSVTGSRNPLWLCRYSKASNPLQKTLKYYENSDLARLRFMDSFPGLNIKYDLGAPECAVPYLGMHTESSDWSMAHLGEGFLGTSEGYTVQTHEFEPFKAMPNNEVSFPRTRVLYKNRRVLVYGKGGVVTRAINPTLYQALIAGLQSLGLRRHHPDSPASEITAGSERLGDLNLQAVISPPGHLFIDYSQNHIPMNQVVPESFRGKLAKSRLYHEVHRQLGTLGSPSGRHSLQGETLTLLKSHRGNKYAYNNPGLATKVPNRSPELLDLGWIMGNLNPAPLHLPGSVEIHYPKRSRLDAILASNYVLRELDFEHPEIQLYYDLLEKYARKLDPGTDMGLPQKLNYLREAWAY